MVTRRLDNVDQTGFLKSQVGDALVLTPYNNELAAVTGRLEAAMAAAASDVDDLIKAAAAVRGEIVREEFGEEESLERERRPVASRLLQRLT